MAGELRRGKTFQPTVAGSYSGPKHFERKYLKEERIIFKTVTLLEFYLGDNFRIQYFVITKNTP